MGTKIRNESQVTASHRFISCSLPRLEFAGLDPGGLLLRSYVRLEVACVYSVCVCVCFTSPLGEHERDLREESDRV